MKQLVIMPGGFHPFHAGHAALYQSAVEAFPGAEVYVAATNDTSTRPFPFAIKEKLAKLAGVEAGHFVQVKSPFRAEEIVHQFDPNNTQLIFVRSEKDANKPPQGGGTKKDGSPSYLQPLGDDAQPLSQHAYMAYLPTVEFGPGMTSATEIRGAWPNLNEKRKTALIMSLYPATQKNPKLAATVVKMLDTAMGVVDESVLGNLPRPNKRNQFKSLHRLRKQRGLDEQDLLAEIGEQNLDYYTLSNGKMVQVTYRPNINQSPIPFTDVTVSYVNPALKPTSGSFNSTGQSAPWDQAPDGVKQAIEKFVKQPQQRMAEGPTADQRAFFTGADSNRQPKWRSDTKTAKLNDIQLIVQKYKKLGADAITQDEYEKLKLYRLGKQLYEKTAAPVVANPDYMEENIKRE